MSKSLIVERHRYRPIKPWLKRLNDEAKSYIMTQKDKKILVGIPVFRVPGLVQLCLGSLVNTPATVLVIDNAADQDVKQVLRAFGESIKVITNTQNGYCNGGWNQIMKYGLENEFDIIALGSSDVTMHRGWYEPILKRFVEHDNEILIPAPGPGVKTPNPNNVLFNPQIGWHQSFLPRKAVELVYPIPVGLRHWFGDNHMYQTLIPKGWQTVLLNDVQCHHEQSAVTIRVPEAGSVVAQDKIEWERLSNEHPNRYK